MSSSVQAERHPHAVHISPDGLKVVRRSLAGHSEPLARVLLDDINRGCTGGTYYMDGRAVNPTAGDFYAVGGASDGSAIGLSANDLATQGHARAAVQLLREEIAKLHATSDAPVAIGYWINGPLCYLDVSSIVEGRDAAARLACQRGEIAMYSFTTNSVVCVDEF